LKEKEEA